MVREQVEEILDIVNSKDEVINSLPREEVYKKGNCFIRGVWLFIQNSKGELWIPRRVKTKKLCPNALDGSVVGHVDAGESYENAMVREIEEEVNIKIAPEDLVCLGEMGPYQLAKMSNDIRAFIKVYILKSDETPNYNKYDFYESYWLTPEQLLEKIEKGDEHKPSLPFVIKHLFIK